MNLKIFPMLHICLLPLVCFAQSREGCERKKEDTPRRPVEQQKCAAPCNPTCSAMQIRGGAFVSLHEQVREIYGWGLPTMEFEYAYSMLRNFWGLCNELVLWENIGWASKSGESIGFGYYTKLNMMPISLGVSYKVYLGKGVDFYLGAGPAYSFLWIRNYDGFMTTFYNSSQFGLRTKTGLTYTFCTNFFIDIFGDYYYTSFKKMTHDPIQNVNTNFSGFFAGGGFGGKF